MSEPEQADAKGARGGYHAHLKRVKIRRERRKAKLNPESPPTYGKYKGYET